jgi:hypothetical protein
MAYNMQAEGNNGCDATTSINNNEGFDFGVLVQVDASQADALTGLRIAGGGESPAIVARGGAAGGAGVVGIVGAFSPGVDAPPNAASIPFYQETNIGVLGVASGDQNAVAVSGKNDVGTGVSATSPRGLGLFASGANAGVFLGPVFVIGSLTVLGAKSAAVKDDRGSYRKLFCMESPECWFEDFGEAKLVNGKADIKLDSEFASLIKTKSYHVFVSAYGNCKGLYVSKRNSVGFSVCEQDQGASNVRFSYRIVARRKDLPVERLPKVELPRHPQAKPARDKRRLASNEGRSRKRKAS